MANRNVTIPIATGTPGNKTPGTNFLSADYEPDISSGLGQVVTVHLAIDVTATSIITYAVDGVNFHSFLNGVALQASSAIEKQITLRAGDKLNFRCLTTLGLDYLYLDLV